MKKIAIIGAGISGLFFANLLKNSFMIDKNNIQNIILPSFTKKIFKSVSNYS